MSQTASGIAAPGRGARRLRDDRGVATTVVLVPLFFAVVLMMVQGVFWQNSRQAASLAADHAAQAVALHGASPARAQVEAAEIASGGGLRDVVVSVSRDGDFAVAEVTGRAPGLLAGTSIRVHARAVAPTERLTRSP